MIRPYVGPTVLILALCVGIPARQALSETSPASTVHLRVPFYPDKTDQCGPSTLAALLTFWDIPATPEALRQEMYMAKLHGTLPMDLFTTAQQHGLEVEMIRGDLPQLQEELRAGRPVLAMLNAGYTIMPVDHYVLITGFDEDGQVLFMHSAGHADQRISYKKFESLWNKADDWAMLARPS